MVEVRYKETARELAGNIEQLNPPDSASAGAITKYTAPQRATSLNAPAYKYPSCIAMHIK